MNSKHSMLKVLLGFVGLGLLVTNCTLKSSSDGDDAGAANASSGSCSPVGKKFTGCMCSDKSVSYQICEEDGTYGSCVCSGNAQGGASSSGGNSSVGGSNNAAGRAAMGAAGESSDAGAGGEGGAEAAAVLDCYECLITNCGPEWEACAANDETNPDPITGQYCLSSAATAQPGQIENIISCITVQRAQGLAKRDVVRACGSTLGSFANPNASVWAPPDMTAETATLMNCMADAPDELMPGDWATDPTNFPASGPKAWDANTCAKDACTSSFAN